MDYAITHGGIIMEQTPGGQVFDGWRGLEGIATYTHPSGYEGKVWLNVEKPILEESDVIIEEVIIDAK